MLVLSIIAAILTIAMNIMIGVNVAFGNGNANVVVGFVAIACFVILLITLIGGIKGIRNPAIRGRSIATTIISGTFIIYALIVGIMGFAFKAIVDAGAEAMLSWSYGFNF